MMNFKQRQREHRGREGTAHPRAVTLHPLAVKCMVVLAEPPHIVQSRMRQEDIYIFYHYIKSPRNPGGNPFLGRLHAGHLCVRS